MKRFRISFLAVLAVLAIGLTAATKADIFKKVKPTSPYQCKVDKDFIQGDFMNIATGVNVGTRYNRNYVSPPTPPASFLCPGEGLYCAKNLLVAPETFDCDNGTSEFCCAELIANESPCGAGQFSQHPTKVRIWCKSSKG